MNDREKLLYDIRMLHDNMREEVIAAGVQPQQYDFPLRYENKLTKDQLEEFYSFLKTFFEGPYAQLITVRRLRPKEFWDNLSIFFQQHSLTEQRMLRKEQTKVRRAWHTKYNEKDSYNV